MIEPMRLLTLIVPEADRVTAVDRLQDLGVMQVEFANTPETAEQSGLAASLADTEKVLDILQMMPDGDAGAALSGPDTVAETLENVRQEQALQRELEHASGLAAGFASWGHFDLIVLERARQHGLHIYACSGNAKVFAETAEKYTCVLLGGKGSARRFAVLADHEIASEKLPLAGLPDGTSLSVLEQQMAELRRQIADLRLRRSSLKQNLSHVKQYREELAEKLEFIRVRDTVSRQGKLAVLTGFVPEKQLDVIRKAAAEYGWGFADRAADPSKENVPTLLKTPRWVKLIDPLMDFLGILPGYDERDVNLPVLIFFTVFFGMLIGDAGYGALYLVCAAAGFFTIGRKKPALRLPLALFAVLSCAAAAWGWMTGNCFGISIPGLHALTDDPRQGENTQLVCFSLALAQLALAHILRMTDGGIRNILGQIGWILVLTGNFMLVYSLLIAGGPVPGWVTAAMLSCYGAGIVLAAVSEIDLHDVGTIFSFPFSIVSSFVDILSYIRLFAVGMSGFYLAKCFNDMAKSLFDQSVWLIPAAVIVVIFGHLLNIALGAMGVLVHGVRLNTLEFSSHLGLRWAGNAFAPFRHHDTENNNKIHKED